ncbi:MAG: sulfate ABC transporter permease subunit CysT [Solirubrobacterales bacterium]|nr:sulfate ABC transporter permease subunit CysT [Solirubrobacterales bacterium]MCB0869737.1 sulfate ABC transporter permease subunit CysT [Solirubrobacterales bacterium]
MSEVTTIDAREPRPRKAIFRLPGAGQALNKGLVVTYLGIMVLLPIVAITSKAFEDGISGFWDAVSAPQSVAALKLTVICSLIVVVINAVMGTLIAWVLVRDKFPGQRVINSIIDLPFALPTIVASLILLTVYGADSPLGIHLAFTKPAIVVALLFVTLPFVVRAVQPLLLSLDRDMEAAAESLGARKWLIFRRVIFPNLAPGIATGVALAFARALGEFGSLVLVSGNIPFQTEVASVYIRGQIEFDRLASASAVSVVLLAISLALLASVTLAQRWGLRHDR